MKAWVALLGCVLVCLLAPSRAVAAAPTPRSTGLIGTAALGATAVISSPAGATAGDLLIAAVNASGTGTIGTPPGWTAIADDASGSRLATFYRVLQAGDSGLWSASLGSLRTYTVNVVAYAAPDPGTPIDVSATTTGTGGALTAPAATSTLPNEAVLFVHGFTATLPTSPAAAPSGSTLVSASLLSTAPSSIVSLDAAATDPGAVTVVAEDTVLPHSNAVAQTIVLREAPTLTASFPAPSYSWGSWAIGTAISAERSISVASDRSWGVRISADRTDGRMTEYDGAAYLSRALASPLQWGMTRLDGVARTPAWTDLSGTPAAVVSGQPAKASAVGVGVTYRQPVSYSDDAGLGGHQYRIVITYNAGQGF